MNYIVLDTETTGLRRKYSDLNEPCSIRDNGDEVVQIGGLLLDEDLRPYRSFCHYCDCLLPSISADASRVNRLDLQVIRQYIPGVFLEEVVTLLVPELLSPDLVLIGYNAEFDLRMVAQSMRNHCFGLENFNHVMTRFPSEGKWYLDVLDYLPKRVKLVSLYDTCSKARQEFYDTYSKVLPLDSNIPELLAESMGEAHNALFDSIETYLVFKTQVFEKRLFRGR